MSLEALLASGRLGATPLRWLEPLFARAEARWTERAPRQDRSAARWPFVVGVTGALRGGSWKTPLSVALARALAERCDAVSWLGRGYRAGTGFAGKLWDEQAAAQAGDEAFAAWRALEGSGVELFVASPWRRALSHVVSPSRSPKRAGIAVLDGHRQRLGPGWGRSLVAVDGALAGATPWPRAPGLPVGPGVALSPRDRWLVPVVDVRERARGEPLGATYDVGWERPLDHDEAARALLVTTHARPARLVAALARRGLSPRAHLALADHADARALRRALARETRGPFSCVLAADKAALALRGAGPLPAPLVLLSCVVSPEATLVDALLDEHGKFCR